MFGRGWLAFVVVALTSNLQGCASESRLVPRTSDKPDIVLVSIDSLRYDHLGCYGYPKPTTPTIDRLAREGARFTNAVSTTSWTLPAHAALFTGLYDSAHGLVDNGLRLAERHETLAEVLRDAGYRTAGFFGAPYLHPTFGLAQGFELYQSCMTRLPDDLGGEGVRAEARAVRAASHADVTGPRTLEEVGAWIESMDGRPFFLFIHMWDVHYDYMPPKRYVAMFDPDYHGDLDASNHMRNAAIRADMKPRDLEHLIALYDAEIRFTDEILGEILARLAATGRLDETIVVVTSDHGEEFFEHGGKGHQRTLFEEVIRVPLVLRWPGRIQPGLVIDDQVRLIDLMPTLLSLAGSPIPAQVQGRDLSPLWRGSRLPQEAALSELLVDGRRTRGLRTNERKLITFGAAGSFLFFDLAQDPSETRNLGATARGLPGARASLEATLHEARALHEHLGGAAAKTPLDAELQRRLEALGYLGGTPTPAEETGPAQRTGP